MKNRRLFSSVMAVVLSVSAVYVPLSVSAEDETTEKTGQCGENLYYSLNTETGLLHITGTGDMYDKKVQKVPGQSYEEYWSFARDVGFFAGWDDIVSVVVDEGVTSIGNQAFYRCPSFTSITLPDSITRIGNMAFYESNLTDITIPDTVTSFGNLMFNDTPWLEARQRENPLIIINNILLDGTACTGDVVIPDGVKAVEAHAFYQCEGITSVEIPEGVTYIGLDAFYKCSNLESVTVPDSVEYIGGAAFFNCNFKSFNIPKNLTSIEGSVFYNCWSLESITIPDNITTIKGNAFLGCESLESVVIPESVTSISSGAFDHCTNLESVTVLNPYCEISNFLSTFQVGIIIRGYEGSTAQEWARFYIEDKWFDFTFESLGEMPEAYRIIEGDANGDGAFTIADTVALQKWLLGTGSLANWRSVDLCKDNRIDVFDMVEMRKLVISPNK